MLLVSQVADGAGGAGGLGQNPGVSPHASAVAAPLMVSPPPRTNTAKTLVSRRIASILPARSNVDTLCNVYETQGNCSSHARESFNACS